MKIYVWTEKAESRAKELGLEPRPAGVEAWYGYGLMPGMIANAWLEMGYIREEVKA